MSTGESRMTLSHHAHLKLMERKGTIRTFHTEGTRRKILSLQEKGDWPHNVLFHFSSFLSVHWCFPTLFLSFFILIIASAKRGEMDSLRELTSTGILTFVIDCLSQDNAKNEWSRRDQKGKGLQQEKRGEERWRWRRRRVDRRMTIR